ncbi:formylmethanofuran dehydrogenase subunit A [Bradyrhizobium sp. S3.9.2]|uniref:terminase small subunit-like protein n=1 Tax=Bradyrhizobium sp. S3.9.2 TaxID=3156432 RepID=UPI003391DA8E
MAPFAQQRLPAHLKPGMGRPSEYKPEYCEMVIEAMARGLSLTAFAGMIRKSRDTVYQWVTVHRDFADAVSRARSARTLALEEKLLRSRKGAETTAAMFALKNAQPDEWRDLKHTETTHLHAIAQLTDAQLMAIASGKVGDLGDSVIDGTCERVDPQQGNGR